MDFNSFINYCSANVVASKAIVSNNRAKMAKVTAYTTTNSHSSPSVIRRTNCSGYLVDSHSSSSKSVIGRPVESFSNTVGTDRIIKEACNIGGAIAPSFQRLLLELPTDDDRLAVANFIIESYHDWNISNASRDLGQNLSKEKQDEIRFDYVDGNISPRFMYNRIMPFLIPQNQNSITQDILITESLLRKKYPQYIDKIVEGSREVDKKFPIKKV